MELGLGLGAVVGLDRLDTERQLFQRVVEELGRCDLVLFVVDAQHPDAGAVVNGGVLVVLSARVTHPSEESHIHPDLLPRLGLLASLPALLVGSVSLRGRGVFIPRRLRTRPTRDGLIAMSRYRLRYIEILCGPKW